MSPEQARGQAVDARADLWAFGCVCYEMLAGRRAFDGETASDAISAVLTRDPDWSALPERTPAPVRRLLRRCLARDVTRRLRHAGDVRLELEDIAASPLGRRWPVRRDAASGAVPLSSLGDRRGRVHRRALARMATCGVLTARARAAAPRTTRLELRLPAGLELFPSTSSTVVASPDGRSVAFVGTSGGKPPAVPPPPRRVRRDARAGNDRRDDGELSRRRTVPGVCDLRRRAEDRRR